MSNPNVLEYARYYGLALDHRTECLQQVIQEFKQDPIFLERIGHNSSQSDLNEPTPKALSEIRSVTTEAKMRISVEQSQLLQRALNPLPISIQNYSSKVWQGLLPDDKQIQSQYLATPLLCIGGGDVQADMLRVKKGVDVEDELQDFRNAWRQESRFTDEDWSVRPDRVIRESAFVLGPEKLETTATAIKKLEWVIQHRNIDQVTHAGRADFCSREAISSTDIVLPRLQIKDYMDCARISIASWDQQASSLPFLQRTNITSPADDTLDVDVMWKPLDEAANELFSATAQPTEPMLHCREFKGSLEQYQLLYPESKNPKSFYNPSKSPEASSKQCRSEAGELIKVEVNKSNSLFHATQSNAPMTIEFNIPKERHCPSNILMKFESDNEQEISKRQNSKSLRKEPAKPPKKGSTLTNQKFSTSSNELHHFAVGINLKTIDGEFFQKDQAIPLEEIFGEAKPLLMDFQKPEYDLTCTPLAPGLCARPRHESITGESDYLQQLLGNLESPVHGEKLLQKSPGLKILNNEEEDEEKIHRRAYRYCIDVCGDGLPIHEQLAQTCTTSEAVILSNLPPRHPSVEPKNKATLANAYCFPSSITQRLHKTNESDIREGFTFSASASLSAFLALRGKQFTRPESNIGIKGELSADPIESTQGSDGARLQNQSISTSAQAASGCDAIAHATSVTMLPECQPLSHGRTIVMNNELMQSHAGLVAFIDHCGADLLRIIYRDFTDFDGTAPDLILNPHSCLVITNIQSFEQRCLPGQKKKRMLTSAHEKLLNLGQRYDRVIVLIAWPHGGTTGLTTINELTAFCSSVYVYQQIRIEPRYIRHLSVEMLSEGIRAWTWASIASYAFSGTISSEDCTPMPEIMLIQEETTWELFLRKAGMNIFAAQIILSLLTNNQTDTQVDELENNVDMKSGLRQFIRMSLEERLKVFGAIVGTRTIVAVSLTI